jgi:threonine dehydrogenase-like Zn-dependent dehydrogenase
MSIAIVTSINEATVAVEGAWSMRSLWFLGPGKLEWRDVPEPSLAGPAEALIRPVAAATCDIDRLLIAGRPPYRPDSVFAAPFAVGHEGVGRVVEVGDAVCSQRVAWDDDLLRAMGDPGLKLVALRE